MKKNEVYVTTDLDDKNLWCKSLKLTDVHWINGTVDLGSQSSELSVRTRYRAPLIKVKSLEKLGSKDWQVELKDEVRALTPGQSAVFYDGKLVLGGGIVI